MKKPDNKVIERRHRLEKGYKTRLKDIVKKKGFGGMQYVAENAQIHRHVVKMICESGKASKAVKQKIEAFIDKEAPLKTSKHAENAAA